jgi:hypothetical protein
VASEGDDAIPINTREVRQLGISQPDIWPVLNPVCVRVDLPGVALVSQAGWLSGQTDSCDPL